MIPRGLYGGLNCAGLLRHVLASALFVAARAIAAADPAAATATLQHPLELRALTEPEAVLAQLPAEIATARAAGDARSVALLYLAQANACRVMADWLCQQAAGAQATTAAEQADDALLVIRGEILESRATMALQDYTRAERLLGDAAAKLAAAPSAELAADVNLAWSSLGYALGKHAMAAEYANRGLALLERDTAPAMQARLLRNLARAKAQLGQPAAAQAALRRGLALSEHVGDPKLEAEMHLESARIARALHDIDAQRSDGAHVMELGRKLQNTQLLGLAHEVLGLAALDAGERDTAREEFGAAFTSFHALGLARDEWRLARQALELDLDLKRPADAWQPLLRRFLELDRTLLETDRAKASDDFDARLKYAQQELELERVRNDSALAQERARSLAAANRLTLLAAFASIAIIVVLGAFYAQQRRSNRRLQAAFNALRASEARASDLLHDTKGYVLLHDMQGSVLMANPAVAAALGQTPAELVGTRLADHVATPALDELNLYLQRVQTQGDAEGTLLVRTPQGERYWRHLSRLSAPNRVAAYVIVHALDVTDQVLQTRALREQSRHDELTDCYNRRYLDDFETHYEEQRWAVVNIDLDHFKAINDAYGHERGDQVLVETTRFLLRHVRDSDALVRLGGDEFAILVAQAEEASVLALVDRLRRDAAQAPCGYSVGYALREGREPLAGTLHRADAAMYRARSAARDAAQNPPPREPGSKTLH